MSKKPNTKLESDNDRINDSFTDIRQRISAEQTRILSTVRKRPRKDIDFDITEHEVHKFLIIFHALMEEDIFNQSLSEQFEEVDGVVTDLLIKIVLKIADLLRQNIETLPVPSVFKEVLHRLKELFNAKRKGQGETMEATKLKECASQASSSSSSSSSGESESEQREGISQS